MEKLENNPETNSEQLPQPKRIVIIDGHSLAYEQNMVELVPESQPLLNRLMEASQPLSQRKLLEDRDIGELNEQVWFLQEDIKEAVDIDKPIIKESSEDDITYKLSPELEFTPMSKEALADLGAFAIRPKKIKPPKPKLTQETLETPAVNLDQPVSEVMAGIAKKIDIDFEKCRLTQREIFILGAILNSIGDDKKWFKHRDVDLSGIEFGSEYNRRSAVVKTFRKLVNNNVIATNNANKSAKKYRLIEKPLVPETNSLPQESVEPQPQNPSPKKPIPKTSQPKPDRITKHQSAEERAKLLAQEADLIYKAKNGDMAAVGSLMHLHQGIIRLWANKFRHTAFRRQQHLTIDDLSQQAFFGMLHAIANYDLSDGRAKFATFLSWHVRQQMTRLVYDWGSTIRLPVHTAEKIKYLERGREELIADRHTTTFSNQELADGLDIPYQRLVDLLRSESIHDAASLDEYFEKPDDFYSEEDEEEVEEPPMNSLYPGANSEFGDAEAQADEAELSSLLSAALDGLDEREREVLVLRFGLVDGVPHTLEQVGQVFGLTRERIRQIESRSLKKIRSPRRIQSLLSFVGKQSLHY